MRRRGGFQNLIGRRNRTRARLGGLVVAALAALYVTSLFVGSRMRGGTADRGSDAPAVLAPEVPVVVHTLPAHEAFLDGQQPGAVVGDADAAADTPAYDRDGPATDAQQRPPGAHDGAVALPRDGSPESAVDVSVVVAMREGENAAAALHSVCRGASLRLEVIVVHAHALREEQHLALQAAVARFPLKVLSVAPARHHHGGVVSLWSMLNHGAEAAAAASHSILFFSGALQPRDADFVDQLVAALQGSPDAGLVGCTTVLQPRDMAPAPGATTDAPTAHRPRHHRRVSAKGDDAVDAASAAEDEEVLAREPAVIGQKGYSVHAAVHGTRVAVAKRLAGFTERDPRGRGCDTVDLPSLSCLAVPRKLFYDAGGLAPVESLGDMAAAGRLGHDAKRDIGRALVRAVHAAEDALDRLNAADRRHMQEYVGLCMDAVLRAREVATKAHIALARDKPAADRRHHADEVVTDEQLDALCREVRNSASDLSEVVSRSLGAIDTPALDLVRFAESKGLVAKSCGVMALERFDWLPASLREGRREFDAVSFLLDPADGVTDSTVAYFHEKLPGGPRHASAAAAAASNEGEPGQQAAAGAPLRVVWDAFCCGCCGFSNEIVHFVQPLQSLFDVALIPKPECFCSGFPSAIADTLARLQSTLDEYVVRRDAADEVVVWVSHTDPMSYRNRVFERRRPDYVVGRSMYEFTRIDAEWAAAANADADEIWVPAGWVRSMFVASGVDASKLVVIPEAVDTDFFDPAAHGVIALPPGADPTAPAAKWRHWCNRDEAPVQAYKFHSSFKWEPRKGWDVLFAAYHRAFKRDDAVSLYVHTHIWFSGGPETYGDARNVTYLREAVEAFAVATLQVASLAELPHFCFIAEDLAEHEVAELYNAADAFVLPTRGEGWGLPIIEAMAMGKPAIATAWGGQLEFMTPETAFLIPVDAVEELGAAGSVYRPRPGKKWAQPSTAATARLMRLVFDYPDKARAVGRRARQHIERDFSETAVRDVVAARLRTIRKIVLDKRVRGALPDAKPEQHQPQQRQPHS